MSHIRKQSEYEKTFAYRFFRWLGGEKDVFVGNMEMRPQLEYVEEEATIEERMRDRQQAIEAVYDSGQNKELEFFNRLYKCFSIIFCVAIVAVLVYAISYLPSVGAEDKPTNNIVSETYISDGYKDTGALNVVTAMILSYRGFDTFGETNVLFIAACCVTIMLMVDKKKIHEDKDSNDRGFEPGNDVILQVVAKLLVPTVFLFGICSILNGSASPGGGFSGGAMIGAGMILYSAAFGFDKMEQFFNDKIFKCIRVVALSCYGLTIMYYILTGANGMTSVLPQGEIGEIMSGSVTACTMYALYAMFRRGGL